MSSGRIAPAMVVASSRAGMTMETSGAGPGVDTTRYPPFRPPVTTQRTKDTHVDVDDPAGSAHAPVSVVIVTWNCEATLGACLAAVRHSDAVPGQIICVDNGSSDGSADIARAGGALVIELGRNAGFPHAVNQALPHCDQPTVLLLNPDVVVEPSTIRRALGELEGDQNIGLVGANLRQPDGQADLAAARRFRTLGLLAIESIGLSRISRYFDPQYLSEHERTTSRDVPCINGAFAMTWTALLRSFGGLDETVFLYLEDQQLCRDVAASGRRVRFAADAVATHQVSAATLAARPDQQVAAYLHRIDASTELINRLQGPWHRRAAICLWMLRVVAGWLSASLTGDKLLQARYATAARWLSHQLSRRRRPPSVPV
jgi:N-acetylglucosaminyl-diphospho-decaprenol L-rhamnosyltransferase